MIKFTTRESQQYHMNLEAWLADEAAAIAYFRVAKEDLVVLEEMDDTQYILKDVPKEFQATLSYMAYERGHYAGQEECNCILRRLVFDLLPTIRKFEARIRRESF